MGAVFAAFAAFYHWYGTLNHLLRMRAMNGNMSIIHLSYVKKSLS